MTPPKTQALNLIPLKKADLDPKDVQAQVETLCRSEALENQAASKEILRVLVDHSLTDDTPLTAREVAERVSKLHDRGGSLIRNTTNRLRDMLEDHYASDAKPEEIRLIIPHRKYMVVTPRPRRVKAVSANEAHVLIGRVDARILEPADGQDVYRDVLVRGRIDALNSDLRAWLVVHVNIGYYIQSRVSRKDSEWEQEVKCGVITWGGADGTVFDILLVAADIDGDYAMNDHLKTYGSGHGIPKLPSDTWVLVKRRVIRRDIRPASST